MDFRDIVISNFEFTHGLLMGVTDGLTPEELHGRAPGSRISSIASILAHTVMSEDGAVSRMLQGGPTLYEREGWEAHLGIQPQGRGLAPDEWRDAAHLNDLDAFKQYARAVFAQTAAYVRAVSDEELARVVPTPVGERSVAWVLNNFIAWHATHHLGEICALRGVMGKQGLPF